MSAIAVHSGDTADASTSRGLAAVRFTGIEVMSPLGLDREAHWAALLDGASGLQPTTSFDSQRLSNPISGEIRGFDAGHALPSRLIPATDRMTQLSLVVAEGAIADSNILERGVDPEGVGVVTAATAGGYAFGQLELQNLWSRGPRYISTHQSYAWFYAVNTGQISIRHGLKGHNSVIVADDAGGLDAIAHAARRLGRGSAAVITGGVDSVMCPWGRVAQVSTQKTSPGTDPATAYLPFDARAAGWVHGEGGAHLVVDSTGTPGYGSLLGHGATIDLPQEAPGHGLRRAIRLALSQAHVAPSAVDAVFADAAGVRELDIAEAVAITSVFGRESVLVTAPKAATGRMGCGTAALDVAMALLSIRDQVLPPTVNVEPDPALGLDVCTEPRAVRLQTVLVLARGTGGFNSALLVGA